MIMMIDDDYYVEDGNVMLMKMMMTMMVVVVMVVVGDGDSNGDKADGNGGDLIKIHMVYRVAISTLYIDRSRGKWSIQDNTKRNFSLLQSTYSRTFSQIIIKQQLL